MTQFTLQQAFDLATRHHQAGELAEAEAIYRQILQQEPRQPETLHRLGLIAHQVGRSEIAVDLIGRAIALRRDYPEALSDLGNALQKLNRLDEAISSYRQAIALRPDYGIVYLNLGSALSAGGNREAAIAAYRQAITLQPELAQAHNLLGMALREIGQFEASVSALQQAVNLEPESAQFHCNLGVALKAQGRIAEAIASYRRAMSLDPNMVEPHSNLGNALRDFGQVEQAVSACLNAIALDPNRADAHSNLGNALRDLGRLDEAIAEYRLAIRLRPDFVDALNNLGGTLRDTGELDESIATLRRAIALDAKAPNSLSNLGVALKDKGHIEEAIAAFRQAIALTPTNADVHENLGNAFGKLGQVDASIAEYRRALELDPQSSVAHSNLGVALKAKGQLDEAIASYRRAIALQPNFASAHSNLLYGLHYDPRYDARAIAEEHRRWNEQHVEPLRKFIQPHANDRNPDRRLRIGYVSPDFREHVVGQNLRPLILQRDRERFEVTCYANVQCPDEFTREFQRSADRWRNIVGRPDDEVAEQIRADGIDILVDLALHTANNRLLVFARKPAPVQVTYLGYASSTGMSAMDYRLSDLSLDPPEVGLSAYSEKTLRLPRSYWCYQPKPGPEVSPPPVIANGHITFGCLNNFAKVSAPALELWAKILLAVPNSRLILHAKVGGHYDDVRQRMAGLGVDADRLHFFGMQPWLEYAQTYSRIDIALDPFPYGGGITTCDALWMGVPVITLSGKTGVGRAGRSILSNIGLLELIADSLEQYLQIATNLANDRDRLASLRKSMRQRMTASPLLDSEGFTRDVELAYRQMWRDWCKTPLAHG